MLDKQTELKKLCREIKKCQGCSLCNLANNAVPGEGNPEAEIFFIGEAPGYYEDQQGRPFVGAAGQLLDRLLQKINLQRSAVFIANMIKHRPPNNRDPQKEELLACSNWLDKQLTIIKPRIIVTLGRFSMQKFIANGKISQIHGQPRAIRFDKKEILVVPFFHPAAALRNQEVMSQFERDFLRLPEFLHRVKELEKALSAFKGEREINKTSKQMSLI